MNAHRSYSRCAQETHRRGLEPLTTWFEARYSIRLSYRCRSEKRLPRKDVDLKRNLRHSFSMSTLIHTEAVVLQAAPFKEYDRILTLFSPQGLLKIFVKAKKRDYLHFAALTSPLTYAEFHYTPGRRDLHRLSEGAILKQNLRIRERYETLIAAESIIHSLLRSQWPGKPAPKLYHLFCLFIEHLPEVKNPSIFTTAFLIKILSHEGLLQLGESESTDTYRFAGERYLLSQAPIGALPFSAEEEGLLSSIALCRSLAQIAESTPSPNFQQKIDLLFRQTFD